MKVYSKDAVKLINLCIRKTMKLHTSDLDLLFQTTQILDKFLGNEDANPHISKITNGKFSSRLGMSQKHRWSLDLAEGGLYTLVFTDIMVELGEVIRSLVTGNYQSVTRSLRWILEYFLLWSYIQIDKSKSASDLYEYYLEAEHYRIRELNDWIHHVTHIRLDLFYDRIHLKERFGKPSFGEIVNDLDTFKDTNIKDKNFSKKIDLIKKELIDLYHEFSGIVHVSEESIGRMVKSDVSYPSFIGYEYDKDSFNFGINKIWKVLDLLCCVSMLVTSRFYLYATPSDFFTSTISYYQQKGRKQIAAQEFKNHISAFAHTRLLNLVSLL
jgi:hypothetical protein